MRELQRAERVAVARLHALLELLPRTLDQRMSVVRLTSFEFTLLEALAEADERRLRLSALASRTNATLARLSRVVTGLEKRDLLRRVACAEDGRATNAVLTDAGEELYREAKPVYERAVRSFILAELSGEDVDELARLSLSILSRLDPERRMTATAEGACAADPPGASDAADTRACPADPR